MGVSGKVLEGFEGVVDPSWTHVAEWVDCFCIARDPAPLLVSVCLLCFGE
jgi:hypothetical protein